MRSRRVGDGVRIHQLEPLALQRSKSVEAY
jgi:hypothetical protein